jgi:endonuclease YncB( thermonuclease family)
MARRAILTALLLLSTAAAISKETDRSAPTLTGTVTKILDGDTVEVQLLSATVRVSLQGIYAPRSDQPWGKEAATALANLILHKEVDVEPLERTGRKHLVAIVYLGEMEVNADLVRNGYAWAYRKNMRQADAELCDLEAAARAAKRGLWALPRSQRLAPWEFHGGKSRDAHVDYGADTAARCIHAIGKG